MATTIQLRRGTAAQWAAANTVLAEGEPGMETDTSSLKVGDGVTAWNDLPYGFEGPPPDGLLTGRLLLRDRFQRPNRNIRGDQPDFGPPSMFVSGGGASDANIVGGRMVFTSPTNSPPTIYHRCGEDIGQAAGAVILHSDGDGTQQAIVGTTPTVFGGAAAQLGWSAAKSDWGEGLPPFNWCLFGAGGGGAGKIAYGNFPGGDLAADDATVRTWWMERTAPTTVNLHLPDGTVMPVTDSAIATAWGPVFGYQQRRITSGAGTMDFVDVGATAAAQTPPATAPFGATGLVLPGPPMAGPPPTGSPYITGVEAYLPAPTASQNLAIAVKFKLAATGIAQDILTLRATRTGGIVPALSSWRLFTTGTSNLDLGVSVDGTTMVNKGTTFAALGITAGAWVVIKATRLASDGTIRLYASVDEGATWTLHGGVLSGGPTGPLATSLETVKVGSLDTTVTGSLAGDVAWAEVRDGDGGPLLGRWSAATPAGALPGTQVDAQGNTWWITGTQWSWS